MRKYLGSNVVIWKGSGDSYNVKIEALNVLLSVHLNKQPKSYIKIDEWFNSENGEIDMSLITYSEEE